MFVRFTLCSRRNSSFVGGCTFRRFCALHSGWCTVLRSRFCSLVARLALYLSVFVRESELHLSNSALSMNTSSAIDERNSWSESSLSHCFSSSPASSKTGDPSSKGNARTSVAMMADVSEREAIPSRTSFRHTTPSKWVSTQGIASLP